jgi:hypothetical protein
MKFDYTYEGLRDDACKGDANAALLILQMFDILHLWDDLIDKDKAPTDEAVHACFWNALVAIPSNPFYQSHLIALQTFLRLAIANWKVATDYERAPTQSTDLHVAFVLRSTYIDLVTVIAGICGGPEHAVRISSHIHRLCHNEGFDTFVAALTTERELREKK